MNFSLGVPKGLKRVLEERGVDTQGMKAEEMRAVLGSHPDFQNEKFEHRELPNGRKRSHSVHDTEISL